MRWNRLITSVCIFILGISKLLTVFMVVMVLITALTNYVEAPVVLEMGDKIYLDVVDNVDLSTSVTYRGQTYSEVPVTPMTYFISIDEQLPFYLSIIPGILAGVGVFFFLHLLIKLLKSIEEREFFSKLNVKRLRIIGLLLIVGDLSLRLYRYMTYYFIINNVEIAGMYHSGRYFGFGMEFFASALFLGLMILLVANAFEHGLKLKEEQELTI